MYEGNVGIGSGSGVEGTGAPVANTVKLMVGDPTSGADENGKATVQ
jgi:hypothetical protein